MSDVTYARLDQVLRSLGFSRGELKKNKVYLHKPTGALIMFPIFPNEDLVLPRHLVAVRAVLDAYGIATPLEFAAQFQPTG